LIHIVPVQRPVSRHDLIPKRNLSSFILFKTNGHEFKKLDSSYVQKEASYSLLKFDESACISVFEMSDNWEDTVKEIFDHVSGIQLSSNFDSYSVDQGIVAVWNCYVSALQEFDTCEPTADIRFYKRSKGALTEVGKFELRDLLDKVDPDLSRQIADYKAKYPPGYPGEEPFVRLALKKNPEKPLSYLPKITFNEAPEVDCAGPCVPKSFNESPISFSISGDKIILTR